MVFMAQRYAPGLGHQPPLLQQSAQPRHTHLAEPNHAVAVAQSDAAPSEAQAKKPAGCLVQKDQLRRYITSKAKGPLATNATVREHHGALLELQNVPLLSRSAAQVASLETEHSAHLKSAAQELGGSQGNSIIAARTNADAARSQVTLPIGTTSYMSRGQHASYGDNMGAVCNPYSKG